MTVSTHVLDTERGAPAAEIHVELCAATSSPARARPTATAASASSARPSPAPTGIVFHPRSPFFRRVELEVELGEGHHHVPLLVSSYACATYRGS